MLSFRNHSERIFQKSTNNSSKGSSTIPWYFFFVEGKKLGIFRKHAATKFFQSRRLSSEKLTFLARDSTGSNRNNARRAKESGWEKEKDRKRVGAWKNLIKGNDVVRCNLTPLKNAAVNGGGGSGSFEKYIHKAAKRARQGRRRTTACECGREREGKRGEREADVQPGRGRPEEDAGVGGWHIFRAQRRQFCHACFSQDLCPTVPPFNGALSRLLRLLSHQRRPRDASTSYRPITVWPFRQCNAAHEIPKSSPTARIPSTGPTAAFRRQIFFGEAFIVL